MRKRVECEYCIHATDCDLKSHPTCTRFYVLEALQPNLKGGSTAKWDRSWKVTCHLVKLRDGIFCAKCKIRKASEVHHIHPRKWGGSDHPRNLMHTCLDCHDALHTRYCEEIEAVLRSKAVAEAKKEAYARYWAEQEAKAVKEVVHGPGTPSSHPK